MTRLGDPRYNDGVSSKGLVAKFSPDGKRFVVVLRKGNLETNTNVYSLILFEHGRNFSLAQSPRAAFHVVIFEPARHPKCGVARR